MEPEEERERDWLRRCRRDNLPACELVVRRYQDLVLRTAWLLTGHRQAAEGVAQSAFLHALRHLGRYDPERTFRAWLLGIVANEARMYPRSLARRSAQPVDGSLPVEDTVALLARIERDDERARVRAALARLEEPFRTALVLSSVADLSIGEVAAATGVPAGTVTFRLARGREQLRALLAAEPLAGKVVR